MALGERAGVSALPNERVPHGHRSRSLGRGYRRCRCCGMLAVLVLATVFVPILPTAGSNWRRSGMPLRAAAHLRSPGVTGDETMRGRDDRLNV